MYIDFEPVPKRHKAWAPTTFRGIQNGRAALQHMEESGFDESITDDGRIWQSSFREKIAREKTGCTCSHILYLFDNLTYQMIQREE